MKIIILYKNKTTLIKVKKLINILNDKVDFIYFDINFLLKRKFFLKKKFLNFIFKHNPEIIFDLLPAPDSSLKNNKYLTYLEKLNVMRKEIRKSHIKTLKISHSWLNKHDVPPYKYFIILRNFLFYLKNFFLDDFYKHNKTDFTILTGGNCENNEQFFNTKKIYYKHFDYYPLKIKKKIENNLVYIDQYLYAHPDLLINGVKFIKKKIFLEKSKIFFQNLKK